MNDTQNFESPSVGQKSLKPGFSIKDIRIALGLKGRPSGHLHKLLGVHGIDITQSPEDFIVPMDLTWSIFAEHGAKIGDEFHGAADQRLRPGASDLIVARMLLSATILDALRAFSEAWKFLVSSINVSVTRRETGISLRWSAVDPTNEAHQIFAEGMATVFYGVFHWMAGERLEVLRVKSPASRQSSTSTMLKFLGAPITYSGQNLEVIFAPKVADIPVLEVELDVWRDRVRSIFSDLYIGSFRQDSGGLFADKVRSAIRHGKDQQNMAFDLGISVKTLARRLKQEGCTFRELQNEVRMHRAKSLIQAGRNIEDIGYMLGYQDERSFRRAFHRWVGVSPSAYRSRYPEI